MYLRPLDSNVARAAGWAWQLREDGGTVNDGPISVTQGTVSFQPNIPSSSNVAYTGSPGAADVPAGNHLHTPTTDGTWSGQRGESTWNSTDARLERADRIINGVARSPVPVQYTRAYPDFSPWLWSERLAGGALSPGTITFMAGDAIAPLQTGRRNTEYDGISDRTYDFDTYRADKELARILNLRNVSGVISPYKARDWRTKDRDQLRLPRLSWHHHEDMRTMQLVPFTINSILLHSGGAPLAREARW